MRHFYFSSSIFCIHFDFLFFFYCMIFFMIIFFFLPDFNALCNIEWFCAHILIWIDWWMITFFFFFFSSCEPAVQKKIVIFFVKLLRNPENTYPYSGSDLGYLKLAPKTRHVLYQPRRTTDGAMTREVIQQLMRALFTGCYLQPKSWYPCVVVFFLYLLFIIFVRMSIFSYDDFKVQVCIEEAWNLCNFKRCHIMFKK